MRITAISVKSPIVISVFWCQARGFCTYSFTGNGAGTLSVRD
jgi:hypothetical protein